MNSLLSRFGDEERGQGLLWLLVVVVLVLIVIAWVPLHVGPASLFGLILVAIILAAIFG